MIGPSDATVTAPAAVDTPDSRALDGVARAVIVDRVDRCRKASGAAAALVDPVGARFVSYGRTARDGGQPVDEHTIFEVGCFIHIFDALLLCDMVERGEVALDDPVERYLPHGLRIASCGRPITLQRLATHTSGLPGRQTDPVSDESARTVAGLYGLLSSFAPTRDAGSYYEYSNAGMSLLRHALTSRLGVDFEDVLRARICEPLGLHDTFIAARPASASRMAVGHNDRLEAMPPHPEEMRSTAHDLAIVVGACLGGVRSPLDRALARMLSVRVPAGPKVDAALGWEVETHGDDIVCQISRSFGFRSWIGYRPRVRRGVVLLSNAATVGGLVDLGYHLLDPNYPLLPPDAGLLQPSEAPAAVSVPSDVLERHVGLYQLTPNVVIAITREGDQLFAEKTGKRKVAIVPASPLEFFCREVDFMNLPADTRVTFRQRDGATDGLTLRQRGQCIWLPRLGADRESMWFGQTRIALGPARLRRLAGQFRLSPAPGGYRAGRDLVTVACESDRLIATFEDLEVPLIPKSETEFFIENDVANVQLCFELDVSGRAIGLVGTFDGIVRRGTRVEHEPCEW